MLQPIPIPEPSEGEASQLAAVANSLLIPAGGPTPDPAPQPVAQAPDDRPVINPASADAAPVKPQVTDAGEPLEVVTDDEDRTDPPEITDIEVSEDTEFPVRIDGDTRYVTLRELKRGYGGQDVIRAGNAEVTQLRKQAEEIVQRATQARDHHIAAAAEYNQRQQMRDKEPEIDWDGLRQADETEWMKQKMLASERKEARQVEADNFNRLKGEQKQANDAQYEQHLNRQAQLIRDNIPELADPTTGPILRAKLEAIAESVGFGKQEISQVNDSRAFGLLNRVRKAEEALAAAGKAPAVVPVPRKRVRAQIRPGQAPSPQSRTTSQQKRQERHRQKAIETGHVDDVAKTLYG